MKKIIILFAATVLLKIVKVKRGTFTLMQNAGDVRDYIDNCVGMGSTAVLYKNPAIATAFYNQGIAASDAITQALKDYKQVPTTGNLGLIADAKADGIIWLEGYADKVEEIANADANRSTREQAHTNIQLSFLTPQKLASSSKGIPETPTIQGTITGPKTVLIEVTNGESYIPSQTNFLLVELPAFTSLDSPDPVVELIDGQLNVKGATGEVITKSVSGKGKSTKIKFSNPAARYAGYSYAQNGKKLVSDLSAVIIIKM